MLMKVTICAILLVFTSTLSIAAYAHADAPKHVDIPAGDLSQALLRLSKQYGADLVYRPEQVYGLKTHGAHGDLTTEQAVTRLLQGTTLELRTDSSGAMLIAPPVVGTAQGTDAPQESNVASDDSKEGKNGSSKDFRVAQVDQAANSQSSAVGSNVSGTQENEKKGGLAEIVVTAQKREERLIDVPISIVALSAEELKKRNITSVDDLGLVVPGLSVNSDGSATRDMALRGVSNGAGSSSLIGLYLDEASVTSFPGYIQPDLRTYDLERIEVLRGPQGTLYGEGSVGGTIRFITKNPAFDRFEMNADVAALFTQDGAPGQRIEGVVNIPLIENELALRIAGTFEHDGGWMDQPAADVKNFNEQNLTDVRIKGLWQPVKQFTVNAMAVIHRNDAPPNEGGDANDNYTQVFNLTTTPSVEDDYDLYNLALTYDFTSVRVLSTTSFIEQDKQMQNLGFRYQLTPPESPQIEYLAQSLARTANNWNEELRLTSIDSGPWQWTVGAFYRRAKFINGPASYLYGLPGPPGTPPPPYSFQPQSSNLSKSSAVFGDTSYKATDKLTFGIGLRYFEDDQDSTSDITQTAKFHALSPRIYAQYKLTDQVNTYASAAKGFRSGGLNYAPTQPAYSPEKVWTYELGTKMVLAGGQVSTDAAIFYSDYTDYQIIGILPGDIQAGNITSNAGNARIKGVEAAVTWRPADQWSLSLNGDYLDSYFYKINAISSAYNVGDPPNFVPKYQYTVSAQRDFKWSGRAGFARLDYGEQGRETYRDRNFAGPTPWYFSESDTIHMLNFNMSLQWNDSLTLGFFAQNLLNDRGFVSPDSIENQAARSRPRTVGIQFGVKFD